VRPNCSHTEERTNIGSVRGHGCCEHIWTSKEEVTGGWMKLDNELHNLYSSQDNINEDWMGHIARMEKTINPRTI
jgi:hypothetical protein